MKYRSNAAIKSTRFDLWHWCVWRFYDKLPQGGDTTPAWTLKAQEAAATSPRGRSEDNHRRRATNPGKNTPSLLRIILVRGRRLSIPKEVVSLNNHFPAPRTQFKTLTTLFPGLQQSEVTEDINHWVKTEINYLWMKPLQTETGALLSSSPEWLGTKLCDLSLVASTAFSFTDLNLFKEDLELTRVHFSLSKTGTRCLFLSSHLSCFQMMLCLCFHVLDRFKVSL